MGGLRQQTTRISSSLLLWSLTSYTGRWQILTLLSWHTAFSKAGKQIGRYAHVDLVNRGNGRCKAITLIILALLVAGLFDSRKEVIGLPTATDTKDVCFLASLCLVTSVV